MAKIHVVGKDGRKIGFTLWLDWVNEWEMDDNDLVLDQYDQEEQARSGGTMKRVSTARGTGPVRFARAHTAAREESFKRQSAHVRAHVSDIMSKIGNGRK